MAFDSKKDLKPTRNRNYLAKTYDQFINQFLDFAKTFYPNNLKDLAPASTGGLFTELIAGVADNLSFYLDHQFSELDPETAVETINIERGLRNSGVQIVGASPSVALVHFFIEVPAILGTNGGYIPDATGLPIISQNTRLSSDNGTLFTLLEDVDFNKLDKKGNLKANIAIGNATAGGTPLTFILSSPGQVISGNVTEENFYIGNNFVAFKQITLGFSNITDIISVKDTFANDYYQVNSLTQDVVYKTLSNKNYDANSVADSLEIIPAPYRFITTTDLGSRLTTLTFGNGSADNLADDIIPEITDFAIPLYGKRTFPRVVLNPDTLFNTNTLGLLATNTTLTISYRYGGGLSHNVAANSIRDITTLIMSFPNNPSVKMAAQVRSSIEVTNRAKAVGGEDAPTIDELKSRIPSARNSQSRIVSKPDLLSYVYRMPSNLGRVFRAGILPNPNNPLATQIFVVSRDEDGSLTISSDTLKQNLSTFLNGYRMISEGIDILDARIINLQISFEIVTDSSVANKNTLVQNVIIRLMKYFRVENFSMDQPISIDDVKNLIFNTPGVIGVTKLDFINLSGQINGVQYSPELFDTRRNVRNGALLAPKGGIFEIKKPDLNIIGQAI
jgi:hypothetical protein